MIDADDLRDCFAMFKSITCDDAEDCYKFADEMIEARKVKNEAGIAGIGKRKYVRKNYD